MACVAVRDAAVRRRIVDALHRAGWTVVEAATGYHLVQGLAGPILYDQPWLRPSLVVIDALSPGCSGLSVAQGLRDLGWSLPIVLLADRSVSAAADGVHVVEPAIAVEVVSALASATHTAAGPERISA